MIDNLIEILNYQFVRLCILSLIVGQCNCGLADFDFHQKMFGNIQGQLKEAFKQNPLFEIVQTTDYESSLSLTEPFDMSLNSWKMIGNTVLTNKFVR